jgi:Protein of unknown function (DUF1353)
MPFKEANVALKEIDANFWRLLEPVVYEGKLDTFTVPSGFKTDLASVPRAFTWLIPRYGAYTRAAVLHDFLCETKPINRSDADGMFRRVMRELGVPFVRRWMMWAAVRLGSGFEAAGAKEIAIWMLVGVPSIVFMLVPGVVVSIWLVLYSIIEWVFFTLLKPFSHKPVNRPHFLVRPRSPKNT